MSNQLINLQGITEYQIRNDYRIVFDSPPYILIRASAEHGLPITRKFLHENVIAYVDEVFEYKHYRRNGSKFWTAKPGMTFYLLIPKNRISLDLSRASEVSHSYVPVDINGSKEVLNASGGTSGGKNAFDFSPENVFNGWTDWVHHTVSLTGTRKMTKTRLNRLADVALSPQECREMGLQLDINEPDTHSFIEMCAKIDVLAQLKEGMKIVLGYYYSFNGSQGPFIISHYQKRRKRILVVTTGIDRYPFRVKYTQIDYTKTAIENSIGLRKPVAINHVGNIIAK